MFLVLLNISPSEMLDDSSAAINALLLLEVTTDDQAQREEQAGGQQTAGGELTIRNFSIKSPIQKVTSASTSPPQYVQADLKMISLS